MAIIQRHYKPTSPGFRTRIIIKDNRVNSGQPMKRLVKGIGRTGGRNHSGKITMRFRGGSMQHKKVLRKVSNVGPYSRLIVKRLEYDPQRSGYLSLVQSLWNPSLFYYILAHSNWKKNEEISGYNLKNLQEWDNYKSGRTLPLSKIPQGSSIFNIEILPHQGAKFVKAAGTHAVLLQKESDHSLILLPSKGLKNFNNFCLATLGSVINESYHLKRLGKAGFNRILGNRPRVRGVAMNPRDHPHGGKTPVSGGRGNPSLTKWGKLAKWNPKSKSKI